jgi:DNA-directed RNA polymerase specialized sigma24 family protein
MSKLERQATTSMKDLLGALAEARDEIRRSEQGIRRTLRRVERGQPLASAVIADEPSESRQAFDDAMESLTSLRHRTRSLVFALAVEEGLSIGEVGRTWGISRQLASRYVREVGNGTS